VNTFIGHHLDAIQTCRSLPQEDTRLTIARWQLEEHINTFKVHLTEKCSELVFNLDELDSADWEDRKVTKVILSVAVRKENFYHSVCPRSQFESFTKLLACISANDDDLTLMLITSSPIRDSLWSHGLRQDEDVLVRRRIPADVNEKLFFEYISDMLISYVIAGKRCLDMESETAALLMDSAFPYVSARIIQKSGENNILAITFPAHTTNVLQALHYTIPGLFTRQD
jgi:hypothetical protein